MELKKEVTLFHFFMFMSMDRHTTEVLLGMFFFLGSGGRVKCR
jgi:hypothetical protein